MIVIRAPDKLHIFISMMPFSSPNPMFDHLLELPYQDDSNKRSNIGFGEEIMQVLSIKVDFTHLIWISVYSVVLSVHTCEIIWVVNTSNQVRQLNM